MIEADAGCENESWKKISSGYNHEPRKGTPYFFCLDRQRENSVPLKVWYSYWPDNTILLVGNQTPSDYGYNSGCGKGKYSESYTLGYICTNLSDAQAYGPDAVPLYHYRYGSGSASRGKDIDDFYTIQPAEEVNLDGGPIPPKKLMDLDYKYQGIIGYVYPQDAPNAPRARTIETGKLGPTGQCVDKASWYQFEEDGIYSRPGYYRAASTPGVVGFGNPDNAEKLSEEANFEWMYGLNGAIKGAVPRFLGFEDSYDSQFYYYLYDTSYPWNGPLFGIQYALNDIPCCPNADDDEGNPICVPNEHFYSHFYKIRQDSWETTKTRCVLTDESTNAVNESFETIDTDSTKVLFRYTTRAGDFNRGEQINGWNIVSVLYYGDQLKCGIMELEGTGNAFTYLQQFTSTDNGTCEILAGYGITDKCAFAGVYEFPKKVDFYKVEISPKALVPNRTLDQAKFEAIINDKGGIDEVVIINSGRGYTKNAKVTAITPKVLKNFSATDTTQHLEDLIKKDPDWNNAIGFTESSFTGDDPIKDVQVAAGSSQGSIDFPIDHDNIAVKLSNAKLKIAAFDEIGGIERIRVVKPGSGYDPEEPPDVFVSDPEYIEYESPDIGDIAALGQGISDQFQEFDSSLPTGGRQGKRQDPLDWINTNTGEDFAGAPTEFASLNTTGLSSPTSPNQVANTGFTLMNTPIASAAPDSYIRMAELDEDSVTKLCFDLPPNCLEVNGRGNVLDAIPKEDFWEIMSGIDDRIRGFESKVMPDIYTTVQKLDEYQEQTSHVYGPFQKDRCLTMGQPKVYNIRRWFDMPCAYISTTERGSATLDMIEKGRNLTEERAFGYLPYKYCASKIKEAEFNVSIMVEGKVTGSQGAAFMNFMENYKKPKVTPRRKVSGGYKTWNCNNGSVDGRCYRDPNDSNDIIFVPVGLDENTFDYNRLGFSEYEQFQLWLGDNLTGGALTSGASVSWAWDQTESGPDDENGNPTSTTTSYSGNGTYTAFGVDCSPNPANTNVPNHECWDTYARKTGAPADAPLDVYCGYDSNGDPIAGNRFWEITGPGVGTVQNSPTGPVNPFCSSCTPAASSYYAWIFGGPPAAGLENVNDASIAIDPSRMYTNSDGDKVFKMGSYSGTMRVRNWLTGGVQALSNALNNFGNPYFSECDVARPDTAGKDINQEF